MSFQAMAQAVTICTNKPTDKLVLLMLANYADENNQAYPSYKRLAEDCCMTERGVKAIMGRLRKEGWVTWIRRKKEGKEKEYTSNLYTLHLYSKNKKIAEPLEKQESENPAQVGHKEKEVGGSEPRSPGVVNDIHQGSEPRSQKPIIEPINKNQTTTTTANSKKIKLQIFIERTVEAMTTSNVPKWFIAEMASELWEQYDNPRTAMAMKIIYNDWTATSGKQGSQ